jgi:hypothetical protein
VQAARAALGRGILWWLAQDEDGFLQIGAVPHLAAAAGAAARLLSALVTRRLLPSTCEAWAAAALRVSQWDKHQVSPPCWNPRPACRAPKTPPPRL